MQIGSHVVDYSDDEEHILRRLGGAVVKQWSTFSDDEQERIVAQATQVFDRVQTVQLRQQIEAFLREHGG